MARVIRRREFLARSGFFAGVAALMCRPTLGVITEHSIVSDASGISFQTTDPGLQSHYQSALDLLAPNVQRMSGYQEPVLSRAASIAEFGWNADPTKASSTPQSVQT
jgi:hypothetical protein